MGQRDEQERGREMSESEAERCLGRRVMPWSVCDALDAVLQNDGLLDVVQQLSHALEEAAKTEDEMRLVNAAMHRNEKDQTAEMAQLQGAVAIQRNATLSTKCMLSREKVPPVPAPLLILSTVERARPGDRCFVLPLLPLQSQLHALVACCPATCKAVHPKRSKPFGVKALWGQSPLGAAARAGTAAANRGRRAWVASCHV